MNEGDRLYVDELQERIQELEADNKQLVDALESGGSTIVEVEKVGKIHKLQSRIEAVRKVRDDLATQTLNSHAVAMLDKALGDCNE